MRARKDPVSPQFMSAREAPAVTNVADGIWLVQTPAGIVSMTLDQLDVAFQRGDIDADTRVVTAGMSTWQTLGAVAGLDDPAEKDGEAASAGAEPPLELIAGGSFPPTSSAAFNTGRFDWQSAAAPEQFVQTGVRRALTRVPFPLRRAVATLVDALALSRRRLVAVGLCVTGVAVSAFFVTSLYRLGSSSVKPGVLAKGGLISARTIPAEAAAVERTSAAALPVPAEPRGAAQARREAPAAPATPVSAALRAAASDDDIAVVRPNELRLAPRVRSESRNTRAARARVKARSRSTAAARASRRASKLRRSSTTGE